MNKVSLYTTALILSAIAGKAHAQVKDSTIGSEVVNVVGTYTPTISDAFKVKETPSFDDATIINKEEIQYSILSFPVASTFVPEKGSAEAVERAQREAYFRNYALLGIGNYGTILGELYVNHQLKPNQTIGGMLKHHSSQGGISDVVLDDHFYDTSLDLNYTNQDTDYNWGLDAGYRNQVFNWYGLPAEVIALANGITGRIDEQQSYNTFYLGGKMQMHNPSIFHGVEVFYKRFWDALDSGENRLVVKPTFQHQIMNYLVKFDVIADYVGTQFDKTYYGTPGLKYSYFNFGVQPSFNYNYKQIAFKLGAGLFYSAGKMGEESKNKLHIYPQVQASYRVVGDLMIAYAGLEGTLKQNSYADLAGENPFINPTVALVPTSQVFDFYVGLKGKLSQSMGYNIKGSFINENDKPLFISMFDINNEDNTKGYVYGNSFNVMYDDVKTMRLYGELNYDVNDKVGVFVSGTFNSYKTDKAAEAWHLPALKFDAGVQAKITDKLSLQSSIYYVGERDVFAMYTLDDSAQVNTVTKTLDGYLDLNLSLGYKYSNRLDFFLKGNNLTSKQYEKWFNYPVQGIQIVGGASYKFDF